MKKYGVSMLALLVCGVSFAAQDTALTQREVRDPRQLEVWLEGNATDAQTRLAACEAGAITLASGKIIVGNSGGTGEAVTVSGDILLSNTGEATIQPGAVEASMIAADVVTNVLASGMVLPAVDGSAVTNIDAAALAKGSVATAIDGGAVTNLDAANLAAGSVASAIDGAAITNLTLGGAAAATEVTCPSTLGTNILYFGAGGMFLSNTWTGI